MAGVTWANVYPLLWAYRPNPAAYKTAQEWRKAVQDQAKAAAVDAVARDLPQPEDQGRPLFISKDPLGMLWRFKSKVDKRGMWANWLASEWLAGWAIEKKIVPPTYSASAPLVKAAEQQMDTGSGLKLPILVAAVAAGVWLWKRSKR